MGIIYEGPYAEQLNRGCQYPHEGYADRKMPDGGFSNGEWSDRFPDDHIAFVAACGGCGWRGTAEHPPTDAGEQAAKDEWDRDHLQPMIAAEAAKHTVPATALLEFVRELRQAARDEHRDGGDNRFTPRGLGLLDAAHRVEDLLDRQEVAR